MKAIMISDKPKWCALMMNGDKLVEIRKKALADAVQKLINEYGYAEIYVYCTKDKYSELCYFDEYGYQQTMVNHIHNLPALNGKVLFKFRCYKVGVIHDFYDGLEETEQSNRHITISTQDELLNASCLTEEEIRTYGGNYAIHISDLEIFDKPRELGEFSNCDKYPYTKYIGKAPQNFVYVESEE